MLHHHCIFNVVCAGIDLSVIDVLEYGLPRMRGSTDTAMSSGLRRGLPRILEDRRRSAACDVITPFTRMRIVCSCAFSLKLRLPACAGSTCRPETGCGHNRLPMRMT